MPEPLSLMAVHAHPDDESIGTGGVLARYAAEGVRTVLVTCTGGEVGEIAHPSLATPDTLAHVRERELRAACAILNVGHLELLGYRDSGMAGTADNEHPHAFVRADLERASARLADLVRRHRPQVIVTYDENGFYGHPDHINAHRIAARAYDLAAEPAYRSDHLEPWSPAKLYYTAVARSDIAELGRRLRELGMDPPAGAEGGDEARPWGTPDELVQTVIDVSPFVQAKRQALFSHASQMGDNVFFARMPEAAFYELFGQESFQLARSRIQASLPEDDLFAGLR